MALIRTERGLDRLVNFSDATVAIAITLLILPLVDAASKLGDHSLGYFFDENGWEVLAFFVSFAIIANFWTVHHRIFESVRSYSGGIVWVNFVWLVSIVLIPFTANILSSSPNGRSDVYALYIGNMLLASVASTGIAFLLYRDPDLMTEEGRSSIDRTRGIAETGLMALALVLAVVFPTVGLFWLFILFLSDPLHRVIRRLVYGPDGPSAGTR